MDKSATMVCRQKGPGTLQLNDDRGVEIVIPVGCWVTAIRSIQLLDNFGEPTHRPAGARQIGKGVLNSEDVIVWEDESSIKIQKQEENGRRRLSPQTSKADPVIDKTPVTTAIIFAKDNHELLREQIDAVYDNCPLTSVLVVREIEKPENVNPAMNLARSRGGRYLPVQCGEAWQAIAAAIEDTTRWLLILDPEAKPLKGVLESAATYLDINPIAGCVSLMPINSDKVETDISITLPMIGSAVLIKAEILRSILDDSGIELISKFGARGISMAAALHGWETVERIDLRCSSTSKRVSKQPSKKFIASATSAIRKRVVDTKITKVSVVMTVHNSLRATLFALKALANASVGGNLKHDVLVIDDCSEEYVGDKLKEVCKQYGFTYSRNKKNLGYSASATKGIRRAFGKNINAEWCCLLNSDTVVTEGWLWRLVRAGITDDRIGMVGPLSNNAVHASIPVHGGDDPQCFAEKIAYASRRYLPDIPTPTGFCLLLKKETWEECGPFDIDYYGKAYGEETDFWAVAVQKGWRAVLADDVFIWHENHGSYGIRGKALEKKASELFMARHQGIMQKHFSEYTKILNSKVHYVVHRTHEGPSGIRKKLCFIINDFGLYGGVLALVNICNRLSMLGWDARIATVGVKKEALDALPPFALPVTFNNHSDMVNEFGDRLFKEGVVCATVWNTAAMAQAIADSIPGVRATYFIQDLESEFVDSSGKKMAADSDVWASYGLIGPKIVNSAWVKDVIEKDHGAKGCKLIPVGVDNGIFHIRKKRDNIPMVLFFYRPETPYRGSEMVRAISRRLADEMPEVRLVSFGGTGTDLPPKMEQRGKISQQHAAELYANSSVFLEASESQGFGLQGLETMGSGSVLVSTKNRGIDNYGKHEKNCLLIDVNDSDAAFNAIKRALNDEDLRKKLIANGRKTALDHDWWRIAEKHADFYGRVLRDEI